MERSTKCTRRCIRRNNQKLKRSWKLSCGTLHHVYWRAVVPASSRSSGLSNVSNCLRVGTALTSQKTRIFSNTAMITPSLSLINPSPLALTQNYRALALQYFTNKCRYHKLLVTQSVMNPTFFTKTQCQIQRPKEPPHWRQKSAESNTYIHLTFPVSHFSRQDLPKRFLPFTFSGWSYFSHHPHASYKRYTSHPTWFHHRKNFMWREQTIKLLLTFRTSWCDFLFGSPKFFSAFWSPNTAK